MVWWFGKPVGNKHFHKVCSDCDGNDGKGWNVEEHVEAYNIIGKFNGRSIEYGIIIAVSW